MIDGLEGIADAAESLWDTLGEHAIDHVIVIAFLVTADVVGHKVRHALGHYFHKEKHDEQRHVDG